MGNDKTIPVAYKGHHPSRQIVLKSGQVDLRMIPLVQWVNSHYALITTGCCQGYDYTEVDKHTRPRPPWITFVPLHRCGMVYLLEFLGTTMEKWHGHDFARMWEGKGWQLSPISPVGGLMYKLEFESTEALKRITEQVRGEKVDWESIEAQE